MTHPYRDKPEEKSYEYKITYMHVVNPEMGSVATKYHGVFVVRSPDASTAAKVFHESFGYKHYYITGLTT
jgi:hypothetical protein